MLCLCNNCTIICLCKKWIDDEATNDIKLENPLSILPDPYNDSTWYDKEHKVYGKWRPFQLAFVLMNLQSMADKENPEREIVDLIWFPTGGGKTEAYLIICHIQSLLDD